MDNLQKFDHWVRSAPNLIASEAPFSDFSSFDTKAISSDAKYQGNSRLGFFYQHLCTEVFKRDANYEIKLEEVQLSENGRTLGAIDLIVDNLTRHQLEHWEVAIKFYLLKDGIWYGPNAHDQLDKKLDRMLNHQLNMSSSEAFQHAYPSLAVTSQHLLMQGRLYTNPFSNEQIPDQCLGYSLNPSQINGNWCYYHQAVKIGQPLFPLSKPQWAIGTDDFSQPIEPSRERFIHAQTKDGQFWFVVPDTWPNNKS